MNDGAYVWLLPHPAGERKPERGGCDCPWPRNGEHARKFLHVPGEARTCDGKKVAGQMGVWVEYEPPTSITVNTQGGDPRYIHELVTRVSAPTDVSQNTDPWVFHPGFVWSVCRHRQIPPSEPPNPGDIVLFGSSKESNDKGVYRWVLDTVFVVEKQLSSPADVPAARNYRNLVASVLPQCQPFIGHAFETRARPFSFAPCQIATRSDKPGFSRPSVNKLLKQLEKARDGRTPSPGNSQRLTKCRPKNGSTRFWNDLVELVFHEGLLLGTSFELPSIIVTGSGSSPMSGKCSPRLTQQGGRRC